MKASYTVEASWIMAIIMSILCAAIVLSFQIYHATIQDILSTKKEVDSVMLFRSGQMIVNIADAIK